MFVPECPSGHGKLKKTEQLTKDRKKRYYKCRCDGCSYKTTVLVSNKKNKETES